MSAAQGLAQGTISFVPGQSRPVRTVPEEPHEAREGASESDGDADDEAPGPSEPAQGPRFKQRTICFGAASRRAPAAAPAGPSAEDVQTLVGKADTGGGTARSAALEAQDTATEAAPTAAAPAKRRRRKRRAAEQPLSDASREEAQDSDPEAGTLKLAQPKVDPRQRTISFAAARARSAPAPGAAAQTLAGAEGSQANPVDLSKPSPQAVEPMTVAAEAAAAASASIVTARKAPAVDACPKQRRRRKRSKAEQPDLGSAEEPPTQTLPPSSAQLPLDSKQQTLSFAGAAPRQVPAAGLLADAAGACSAGPAPPPLASDALPAADAGVRARVAAAEEVPAAEKPKKRAYRKRSNASFEACPTGVATPEEAPAGHMAAVQPQPQADPKERKLLFTAAASRAPANVVSAGPAELVYAAQDTGSLGQPSEGQPPLSSPSAQVASHCSGGRSKAQLEGCTVIQVYAITDANP